MKILITGNPVEGMTFYGPFADVDECIAYEERVLNVGGDWWVAPLNEPKDT